MPDTAFDTTQSLDELRLAHTAATDRALAAEKAIMPALARVCQELEERIDTLDAANLALAAATQAVMVAGGALPPHHELPYLAAPTRP